MITSWQMLTPAQYNLALYNFLVAIETQSHQHADYSAYSDSRGYLSIGVGFNLTVPAVQAAVFAQFGLITNDPALSGQMYASLNATENGYITTLQTAIANDDATTFNATLQARASNTALTAVLGPLPSALTDATAQAAFNTIIGTYEGDVDTWLTGIPDSSERIALVSLAYNSKVNKATGLPKTLGSKLLTAIQSGNRAAAWYEIRYDTNPTSSDSRGIAKRRYYESQEFGLFSNAAGPSQAEVLQAYQMLTQNRQSIIAYEATYGVDPDSSAQAMSGNEIAAANTDYGTSAVQTLAQAFATAEPVLLAMVASVSPLLAGLPQSFATSTNIFVASTSDPTVNASLGDPTLSRTGQPLSAQLASDDLAEAAASHILIGTGTGQTLIGGLGNDILVAGSGSETLTSGLGYDTIIAGGGADTVNLRGATATVDFEFQGQTGLNETISAGSSPFGAVDVGGAQVTGSTASPVLTFQSPSNSNLLTWSGTGSGGYTYVYNKGSGDLTISGGSLGSGTDANSITIQNFNLSAAQNGGFLGISLAPYVYLNFTANAGVDPPATNFVQGSTQSYTVSIDAPSTAAQIVTVTLSGASPSDFEALVGNAVEQLSANGSFNVTLAAGETNIAFSLVDTTADNDTSDIAGGAALTLSASLPNANNPDGTPVQAGSLSFNYVPTPWNTGAETPPSDVIAGVADGGGAGITSYTGDGNADYVSASGPNNLIEEQNSGNDSIVGSTGVNAIYGGSGNDIVVGNGGTDTMLFGNGNSEIYAGQQTSIQNAIAQASSGTATGQQGDFIGVMDGDNTIVGSNGNDFITAGAGNDVVVMGPGNDFFIGGWETTDVTAQWGYSFSGNYFSTTNVDNQLENYTNPYLQPYNGGYEFAGSATGPFGAGSDTIFGGSGSDDIALGNGDNYVDMGTGNSEVYGGMGNDTIIAGSGADYIKGGGGDTYIYGGSGADSIYGGDGNNTIIGGSGNSTIYSSTYLDFAAGGYTLQFANANLDQNYVTGGSGNDVIYGSDGQDTLIAGTGNTTIYGQAGSTDDITGGSGNDLLVGGTGDDTLTAGGSGQDTIAGVGSSSSTTLIYGGDGEDSIIGGSGVNTIYAGDGGTAGGATSVFASQTDSTATTTIYGGSGVDFLEGGAGSSVIYAGDGGTSANPTVVEADTGATTIYGGAGADNLVDTRGGADSIVAGSGDANLVGNGNDTLVAGSGNDNFSGTGNLTDVFSSTSGNTYVDANSSTVTLEFTEEVSPSDLTITAGVSTNNTPELIIDGDSGTITVVGGLGPNVVQSVIFDDPQTLTLTQLIQQADAAGNTEPTTIAGANGNLIFDTSEGDSVTAGNGSDTISAWGDDDTLSAGSAGTLIYAEGDDDVVFGGTGNDTLDALGTGTILVGGTANELFEVSDPTDEVFASGVGSDTILSSVSYTLPTAVDTLTLTGNADLSAYGNSDVANLITGNSGNDVLVAGSGADTLVSGSGSDTLEGGSGGDVLVINNSADVIEPGYYGYTDTIQSSVSYMLNAPVYTLNLTGSGNLSATDDFGYATITGNAGNDTLTGGSGYDELIAGTGVDTFVAGTGTTTFVVNNAADVIQTNASTGYDVVDASVSFTLPTGIDTLTLTGSANLVGTGNGDASNVITANAGIDTLIAGTGSDTLYGTAGDTYVLGAGFGADEIDPSGGGGIVQFGAGIAVTDLSVSLTQGGDGSPALLIQDGTSAVTIDGGFGGSVDEFEFANGSTLSLQQLVADATAISSTLVGSNADTIFDTTPAASLTGGIGDDTIYAFGENDTIIAGSGNQQLYGENANEVLAGSVGDDTLHGGAGDDTLIAGVGNTVMYGGTGNDFFQLTAGGTSTLYPSSTSGADVIYLPTGMTLSQFSAIEEPDGDLILQSQDGDTTAVVKGFYSSAATNKTWLIADSTEAPQFLGVWAGTQTQGTAAYTQEITTLREASAANLGITLNSIGEQGGSITDPTNTVPPGDPNHQYQFAGVAVQNATVSGGVLSAGSSDSDQTQYTYTSTTTTETVSTPIYGTESSGGGTYFLPVNNLVQDLTGESNGQFNDYNGELISNVYDSSGNLTGINLTLPVQTNVVQTGTRVTTLTVPSQSYVENETQSFTDYNITGDGGNDVITANGPFAGTVNTGDGNVLVNLGQGNVGGFSVFVDNQFTGESSVDPIGAFVQAGAGNDTIFGTGGVDTIAAGTGFDYLDGWDGTTYYVPLLGDSTDVLADDATAAYGGTLAPTVLVLPSGVTAQDLQYRLLPDSTPNNYDGQVLELRYGDSTVLINFTGPIPQEEDVTTDQPAGVSMVKFADGTEMSLAELMSQATLLPNDFNPVAMVNAPTIAAGAEVSASGFFSATDSADNPITWYQVTDSGAGGNYFVLNGKVQTAGQTFYVSADQLAQLSYVAGTAGTSDAVSVSAFDGAIWSPVVSSSITPAAAAGYSATGANQLITGPATGPDTLTGGYANDTLAGASGADTFVYTAGAGALTISDAVSNANTLVFSAGVTASGISLGIAADGGLLLRVGTNGDTIDIEGFNANDALNSGEIQNFSLADGTQLSYAQLLAQGFDIYGGSGNESITGTNLDNRLYAGSGDDTLIASGLADTLVGGAGNDTFVVNSAADIVQDSSATSQNILQSSVSIVLPTDVDALVLTGTANLTGTGNSDAANTITGNAGNDTLTAGSGADTLVAGSGTDTLVGGAGADVFVVDNTADVVSVGSTHGNDTIQSSVSYTAAANVANLVLTGSGALTATGDSQSSVLTANTGNDTLVAGSAVTTLIGGVGNDTFVVNSASDLIEDVSATSSNTVQASFSYVLPANINSLMLTGTAALKGTANGANDSITANSGKDTLVAGVGADTLVSGTGVDSLVGGSGLDTFVVNNASDIITAAAGNDDVIESSVNYTLPTNFSSLVLTGTANLTATGNAANDTLTANSGNDTLKAGSGVDTLIGGSGNDLFVVDNAADVVSVTGTPGVDTIQSSVSYVLPSNVADLTLTGTANLSATGNASSNVLTANSGSDTLTAGSGVATLKGGTGSDLFVVDNTSDVVSVGATHGNDTIEASVSFTASSNVANLTLTGTANLTGTGNSLSDILSANSGNDTLTAGSGVATLVGGSGNDTFVVNNVADVVEDASSTSLNTLLSSVSYVLPANVANLTLTGGAAVTATGNAQANVLTANTGADTLIAGVGPATLIGGTGSDTFVVNSSSDVIQDSSTTAKNTVQSSVSYALPSNVNALILTGAASATATANAANDTLTSNSGVDTLVGGTGNDVFIVGNAADVVEDSSATAKNAIQASVSYTLPTNVNALTLTGSANLTAGSNSGNDSLVGNAGNDTLMAGSGTDTLVAGAGLATLVGGTGNDVFVINNSGDLIEDSSTTASNSIQSSVSYTLPTDVNVLTLTGSGNLTATANAGNDTVTSNSGIDTLVGGAGNDVFVVNNASDIIEDSSSTASNTVKSAVSFVLPTDVNTLILTGSASIAGTGNSANDSITGNTGNDTLTAGAGIDTLVAGAGVDTLIGGAGNDTFVVNNVADVVEDSSATSTNTLESSVSYTLPSNVNALTLTGTANLTATANSGNDTLTSNSGIDTLVGGTGSDTFVVKNASDVIEDASATGSNVVESSVTFALPVNVNTLVLTGGAAVDGTANVGNDSLTANSGADTLIAGSGMDTLVSGTGVDSLVGGTGTDTFVVNKTSDVVSVATSGSNDTIQSSVSYVLPVNLQYLTLTGTGNVTGTGNSLTDLIVGNAGNDTLAGGTGIAVLEGGQAGGKDLIKAVSNQAALIAGGGSATLTGGAYSDFYAAGSVSDSITTGATANVVAVNQGDGATTLHPTTGAANVLSLGAGIDTESLYFSKSGNNLILTDGVSGDAITFTNWYASSHDQDYTTLQVVEAASASYNGSGSDPLRNAALEEFNFTALVAAFNVAGSPSNWALSNAMPAAALTNSATAAYGGDLAYYFGLNNNLTGVDLTDAQATLTNTAFATGTQTIDSFSNISGGGGLRLSADRLNAADDAAQMSATQAESTVVRSIAPTHLPEVRGPAEPTTTARVITPRRGIDNPVRDRATTAAAVTTTNTVTNSAVLAAIGDIGIRRTEPVILRPTDAAAKSYIDPVNVAWLQMHSALDQIDEVKLGGAESTTEHESVASDALLSGVPMSRTRRFIDPELHSPLPRQRFM